MNIIRKLVCDEHRCKLLENERILQRVETGELSMIDEPPTPKVNPWVDGRGNLLTHNQESRVYDRRFRDERRIAAKLHRHLTARGGIGASGKCDPKTITLPNGIKHQPCEERPCELCEAGDVIFPWNRFRETKRNRRKYNPNIFMCLWIILRSKLARRSS